MTRPGVLRLYDRDDDEPAAKPADLLRQDLPSGAGFVRADRGGNIVAVELALRGLQQVNPAVLTQQLTTAIQQLQQRAAAETTRRRERTRKRD